MIVVVRAQKRRRWPSLQRMIASWSNTYLRSSETVLRLAISDRTSTDTKSLPKSLTNLLAKHQSRIIALAVVDPLIPPPQVLSLAESFRESGFRVRLLIHVEGVSLLQLPDWLAVTDRLQRFPVHWIAPSSAFQKQWSRLLRKSDVSVFPVDVEARDIGHSVVRRKKVRETFGIDESDNVWIYSGRISFEKNVDHLIEVFEKHILRRNPRSQLLLVGQFDDRGSPLVSSDLTPGSTAATLFTRLRQCSSATRRRIHILPPTSQHGLRDLYDAADFFVSLSTYHNESFGFAPREAEARGLIPVLSDWGGHKDFGTSPVSDRLVPVGYSSTGLRVDLRPLLKMVQLSPTTPQRLKRLKEVRLQLSQRQLRKVRPQRRFVGFSHLAHEISSQIVEVRAFRRKTISRIIYLKLYGDCGSRRVRGTKLKRNIFNLSALKPQTRALCTTVQARPKTTLWLIVLGQGFDSEIQRAIRRVLAGDAFSRLRIYTRGKALPRSHPIKPLEQLFRATPHAGDVFQILGTRTHPMRWIVEHHLLSSGAVPTEPHCSPGTADSVLPLSHFHGMRTDDDQKIP